MTDGLHIEAFSSINWAFNHTSRIEMAMHCSAYYVSKAKACLLIPQQLNNTTTHMKGCFGGEQYAFQGVFDAYYPLVIY